MQAVTDEILGSASALLNNERKVPKMCSHYQALRQREHYLKYFAVDAPDADGKHDMWPRYQGSFVRKPPATDNGANIRSLNQGTLSRLVIPVPPTSAQVQIVAQLEDIDGETKRLESIYQQKLTSLDVLKKSLLHRAFNGDL